MTTRHDCVNRWAVVAPNGLQVLQWRLSLIRIPSGWKVSRIPSLSMLDFIIFWDVLGRGEDSCHNTLRSLVMIENGGKHWLVLRVQRRGLSNGGKCVRAKSNSLISSSFAWLRRGVYLLSSEICRRVACSSQSFEDEGIAGSLHAERFTSVTANFNAPFLCYFNSRALVRNLACHQSIWNCRSIDE